MATSRAFLSSPKTSLEVRVPLPPTAPLHEIQNFLAQSLPSADSWDLLYPIQASHTDVPTFTRPAEHQGPSLRKEALSQLRTDLARSAEERYNIEQRVSALETALKNEQQQREAETAALRHTQELFLKSQFSRELHVTRYETHTRLQQVLSDRLIAQLDHGLSLDLGKFNISHITQILEGGFPQGPEECPRDKILQLAKNLSVANASISPLTFFPTPTTKRMKASQRALGKMSVPHLRLTIQLYAISHEFEANDGELFKEVRHWFQHPRPSLYTGIISVKALEGQMPIDVTTAENLIICEAARDTGEYQSSLFGRAEDVVLRELIAQMHPGSFTNLSADVPALPPCDGRCNGGLGCNAVGA